MDDLEDYALNEEDWDNWLKELDEGTRSTLYPEADAYIHNDNDNDTSVTDTSNAATETPSQGGTPLATGSSTLATETPSQVDTALASGSSTLATGTQSQGGTHLESGSSNVATEIQSQGGSHIASGSSTVDTKIQSPGGTHLVSGSSNVATEIQSEASSHLASGSSNVATVTDNKMTEIQSQGGTLLAFHRLLSSIAAAKRHRSLNKAQLTELNVKHGIPIQRLIPRREYQIGKEKADKLRSICDRQNRMEISRTVAMDVNMIRKATVEYKKSHDATSAAESDRQISSSAEPQRVENEETNRTCTSDSSYPDLEELRKKHINLSRVNWQEIDTSNVATDPHLEIIGVPIKLLIPILEPQIGKEKADQALMVWKKVQNKEISKNEAVSMVRDFLDFNVLKKAAIFYSRLQDADGVSEKQGQKSVKKQRKSRAEQPQICDETDQLHRDTCKKCQDRQHPVAPTETIPQSDKSESIEKHPMSPESTPEETSPPPSQPLSKKQKESSSSGEEVD